MVGCKTLCYDCEQMGLANGCMGVKTYFWLATEPPPARTAGLLTDPAPFFLLPELMGAKPPLD